MYKLITGWWALPTSHTPLALMQNQGLLEMSNCGSKLVSGLPGDLQPPPSTGPLLEGSCFWLAGNGERHTELGDQTERMWSHLVTVLTDGMWPACSLGGVGPACNCRRAEHTATSEANLPTIIDSHQNTMFCENPIQVYLFHSFLCSVFQVFALFTVVNIHF